MAFTCRTFERDSEELVPTTISSLEHTVRGSTSDLLTLHASTKPISRRQTSSVCAVPSVAFSASASVSPLRSHLGRNFFTLDSAWDKWSLTTNLVSDGYKRKNYALAFV